MGGYCQHTEGFGETAEERSHHTLASVNSPFTLFALVLSEHELRIHSYLAGAPCRHLSRPVSVDGQSTLTPAGPSDAIFDTCLPKTGCGIDYFFFRRLVVFFAVFAFAFLFFAIAALLA